MSSHLDHRGPPSSRSFTRLKQAAEAEQRGTAVFRVLSLNVKCAAPCRLVVSWVQSPVCVCIINVYTPHSETEPQLRSCWDAAFATLVRLLTDGYGPELWDSTAAGAASAAGAGSVEAGCAASPFAGRLLVVGDMNATPTPADINCPPVFAHLYAPGVLRAERQGFSAILKAGGLCDVWRALHPKEPGFTYIDPHYRRSAEGGGGGLLQARFDFVLATPAIFALVSDVFVRSGGGYEGNHVPLGVDLRVEAGGGGGRGEGSGSGARVAAGGAAIGGAAAGDVAFETAPKLGVDAPRDGDATQPFDEDDERRG